MLRTVCVFLGLLVSLSVLGGCSSGKGDPVTPQDGNLDSLELPNPAQQSNANHQLLGQWNVEFDLDSLVAKVTENRAVLTHINATELIPPPGIVVNEFNPATNVIDVDITLENPYDIDAYDVRLIIYTDNAGHLLLNPDCWTNLYDIAGGEIINPFVAYAKEEDHRVFEGHSNNTENLLIYLPQGNMSVKFAVDASVGGNCDEPYDIRDFNQGTLYDDIGASTPITINIFDWQDDAISVNLYCPKITNQQIVPFSYISENRWKCTLYNDRGATQGSYTGVIFSGSQAIAEIVEIVVSHGTSQEDNEPPEWSSTAGISHVFPNNERVQVQWRPAFDDLTPPVEYLIFVDEDDYPWDQNPYISLDKYPYVVDGLQNGRTYWFGVRCRDSADPPNVDDNEFVLSTIPQYMEPTNPQIVNQIKYVWDTTSIAIKGNYLYVADDVAGLKIFDVTDPLTPLLTGYYAFDDDDVHSVQVDGNFAYVSGAYLDFAILDVSNPFNPEPVSVIEDCGWGNVVAIYENYVYLAKCSDELAIIDVSDPMTPSVVSSIEFPTYGYDEMQIVNNLAYFAGGGFHTVDLSDPTDPQIMDSIDNAGCGFDIWGEYAVVCNWCQGIVIIDISNPYDLKTVSNLEIPNCPFCMFHDVAIQFGKHAYIADSYNGVAVVDIIDPLNPQLISQVDTGDANQILVNDDLAYVADGGNGVKILDISVPENTHIDKNIPHFDIKDIIFLDDYAICAVGSHGIMIFDISDRGNPVLVTDLFMFNAGDLELSGNYLFSAKSYGGVDVFDVENILEPEILTTYQFVEDTRRIEIAGDYLYIAGGMIRSEYEGLRVINISDIMNPYLVSSMPSLRIYDLEIMEDLLLIAAYSEALIVDISDPFNLQTIGRLEEPGEFYGVEYEGNFTFWEEDFCIVDTSVPSNPRIIFCADNEEDKGILVENNYMYGPLDEIYDVSNPLNPRYVTNMGINDSIDTFGKKDNYLYVCANIEGLIVLKLWD